VLSEDVLGDAFDASIVRSRDRVTGAPSVTALPDPAPDRGETVHVVAGRESGAGLLADLVGTGFEVSVGVLQAGDPDAEVAAQLGCDVVSVPPYTPIDGAIDRGRERAREADATLLADVPIGPANAANLDVVAESANPVLVEDRPFAERNHAGPAVRERYEALRERARITDAEGVLEAVETACEAGARETEGDISGDAGRGGADAVDARAESWSR
jgi:iron complex transport system ATP-binding protein